MKENLAFSFQVSLHTAEMILRLPIFIVNLDLESLRKQLMDAGVDVSLEVFTEQSGKTYSKYVQHYSMIWRPWVGYRRKQLSASILYLLHLHQYLLHGLPAVNSVSPKSGSLASIFGGPVPVPPKT